MHEAGHLPTLVGRIVCTPAIDAAYCYRCCT